MRFSRVFAGLAIVVAVASPALVWGETAKEAFERGNVALAKGDLPNALQAYSAAVRTERTNQEYAQKFMLVRRVLVLRQSLDREQNPQRWQQTAQALRSFYVSQGIYSAALEVDQKLHARLKTAVSVAQLAETQLALGKAAAASETLAALDPNRATVATRALLGIALARQDRTDEARKIAQRIGGSNSSDPGTLYSLARMHSVLGNQDASLQMLRRCFEAIPPSRLVGLKRHAQRCPEFVKLASTAGFASVLETESKVPESKCSSGSSCAGCPMRGGCPKSQGK